jgi:hypothetical protein
MATVNAEVIVDPDDARVVEALQRVELSLVALVGLGRITLAAKWHLNFSLNTL